MLMACSMINPDEVAFASEETISGSEEVIDESSNNMQVDMSGISDT